MSSGQNTYVDYTMCTRNMFESEGRSQLIYFLYPEVANLYNMAGCATRVIQCANDIYTRSSNSVESYIIKEVIISISYEEYKGINVFLYTTGIVRECSEEFYQVHLNIFMRSTGNNYMFDLQHINQRNVTADRDAGRPVCIYRTILVGFCLQCRFLVSCNCPRAATNVHAWICLHTPWVCEIYISRETLMVAARIFHFGDLSNCCGGLNVEFIAPGQII